MKTMRGIWLDEQQLALRGDLTVPEPELNEALVRVRVAGICATDLELTRGYYRYTGVPGHEFVGEVESAPADPARRGQRVVGEINASCHQCPTCRSGRPSHCENRTVLGISGRDGAFAEYLTLPLRNLHRVPAEVTDEQAVFCEPLAAALEILEQVHVQPTDHVLLVGAGRLGQLVAQVLQLTGCRLEVVARHPRQGEILKTRGIRVIPPNAVAPTAADVAIEATGSPDGFTLARRAIRPRGTIVLKSTYATDALLDLSSLVVDEITLVGSRCGPFAPALRLLAEGLVSVEPLVHARHHLSRGVEAFSEAARPGALKIILEVTT